MCVKYIKGMCPVHKAAAILVLVGALNWGLVGLFNFDLVWFLLGWWMPVLARLVYVLVGVSAVALFFKDKCKQCLEMKGKECDCKMPSCPVCNPKPEKKPEPPKA